MDRIIATIAVYAAGFLVILSGCAIQKNVSGRQDTIQQNSGSTSGQSYLKTGFELMESEAIGPLNIEEDADLVTKKLGEAEEKDPAEGESDDGGAEHQTWKYPSKGIELGMARDTGKLKIDMITVTSPCGFSTKRGVKIGSSRDDVVAAYRKEIDPQETFGDTAHIIAGTTNGGIVFTFDNGKVGSIFIGVAAK